MANLGVGIWRHAAALARRGTPTGNGSVSEPRERAAESRTKTKGPTERSELRTSERAASPTAAVGDEELEIKLVRRSRIDVDAIHGDLDD